MVRRLVANVIVADPSGSAFLCSSGFAESDLPKWAVEQIDNPSVWADEPAGKPVAAQSEAAAAPTDVVEGESSDDGPPPRSGPGSAKSAWVAYAQSKKVAVKDDDTRDDIVAAVAAAGHPTE